MSRRKFPARRCNSPAYRRRSLEAVEIFLGRFEILQCAVGKRLSSPEFPWDRHKALHAASREADAVTLSRNSAIKRGAQPGQLSFRCFSSPRLGLSLLLCGFALGQHQAAVGMEQTDPGVFVAVPDTVPETD